MSPKSAFFAALLAALCGAGPAVAQGTEAEMPAAEPKKPGAEAKKSVPDAVPANSTGRGVLVFGADQRVFKPCGGDREFWVNDATNGDLERVYQKLAGGPGKPLFVDVRGVLEPAPKDGAGAAYSRTLKVVEVRRADPAGPGCRENLRYFELRAWGEDPFWRLDVARNGITFSSYGAPQAVAFPYAPPRRDGAETRYAAIRDGANGHAVELVIKPGRCTDPRTGAVTWLSVEGKLDDRRLSGCAYEGERGQ
jgi:uncharacterized membrane protein